MKVRSFVVVMAAVVVLLLLVGLGGAVWLVAQSPLNLLRSGGAGQPAAAMFVPRQAPLMVSLLVHPDRLERLSLAIAPSGKRRQTRTELQQLQQTLLGDRGINYAEDIQPWLGDEITWAVTSPDLDRDPRNGAQPGYLLAVSTRDPQQSREFLQVFWQKRAIAGIDLVFEQYAGVKIISGQPVQPTLSGSDRPATPSLEEDSETVPAAPLSLTTAVVGDRFLLFANSPKVLRDAINNVQAAELGLSHSRAYQEALQQLPDRQIGLTFVNLPQLGQWLGQTEEDKRTDQRQFESLVAGFILKRQGILSETALLPVPGQALPTQLPRLQAPVQALQYIPTDAPVVAAGTDLNDLWHQLSQGLAGYGALSALIQQPVADLEALWQVNFTEDLLGWVGQEFALALLPSPKRTDWVFVAEKTPDTADAIAHLDAIAQQQGLSIGPVSLGDQSAFAWTKLSTREARRRRNKNKPQPATLQASVQGVHTSLDSYEIFATSVEALDQVLKAPQAPLLTNASFEQAIAPLSTPNDGYLYLDWNAVQEVLENRLPLFKLVKLSARPLFEHVRSLTFTSTGSEATLRRGQVLMRLKF